jgi:hypothetical protein
MTYLQAIRIAEKLELINQNPADVKLLKQELENDYYPDNIRMVKKFMLTGWAAEEIATHLNGLRASIIEAGHITTIFRHVSTSGMQRLFTVGFTHPKANNTDRPYFSNMTMTLRDLLGYSVKDRMGMRLIAVNGCGFSASDEIFRTLHSFFEFTSVNPVTHIEL